jgi:hypothetical protein
MYQSDMKLITDYNESPLYPEKFLDNFFAKNMDKILSKNMDKILAKNMDKIPLKNAANIYQADGQYYCVYWH